MQVQYGFILQPFWISTEDNFLPDHLSRAREAAFLAALQACNFLVVPFSEVKRHPDAGRVHTFSSCPEPGMAALRQLLEGYDSNNLRDGPSRGAGVGGDAQLLSISYPTTSIYDGLPPELEESVDEVMDNRLAVSSRSKVMTAVNRWTVFCATKSWSPILESGNKERGGRVAAWVLQMKDETELVFRSISGYVWGMRTWQVLQHQADPLFGVMHWREFMQGIAVLTAVPGEPRRMFPLDTFTTIMRDLDPDEFEDANFGCCMLTLLFTFSRTECPCPKSWSGKDSFDLGKHWAVDDFKLVRTRDGKWVLWVRFKAIKQDPRKERPSMAGPSDLPFEDKSTGSGHDWVPIGDLPDVPEFSIARWYMALVRSLGRERAATEPMFLARDRARPYTYSCLRADLYNRLVKLGLDTTLTPHPIRVLGYNLSKRGNGVEITVAHGGWFSEAHERYERFSNVQLYGIPAGMLQVQNPFGDAGTPREISRVRATRFAEPPPSSDSDDDEPVSLDAACPAPVPPAPLPAGYTERTHVTPSGRTYNTYVSEAGRVARSRAEAWRHFSSRRTARPVQDHARAGVNAAASPASSSGDEGLSAAGGCQSADDDEPYVPLAFDVSSPVVPEASPAVRHERLSDMARRLRSARASPASEPSRQLPFGASLVEVPVRRDQCGNPHCLVKSRNGLHAGDCRFPDPPPRR